MRTSPPDAAGLGATLALGGAIACLGSALLLLADVAWGLLSRADCRGLGVEDCALVQEVARELAWRQGLVAIALLLLAVPLARRARRKVS